MIKIFWTFVSLSIIFFVINLCSCNKSSENAKDEIQSVKQTNTTDSAPVSENTMRQATDKETGDNKTPEIRKPSILILTPEQHFQRYKPVNPETLLKPEEMIKHFPASIDGYKVLPWSGGFSEDRLQTFSSVSAEYITEKKGYISIAVYDYGENGYIRDKEYILNLPQEPGMKTTAVNAANDAIGYLMWNDIKRSGTLFVLIDNRFTIRIEANKIPPQSGTLISILEKIKIKGLIASGRKSPNK